MGSSTTKYFEIQHDEIEVLRSIFMDDFVVEEAKTGAWNKTSDLAFKIRLRSTDADASTEGGSTMTLAVSFPPTYPKSLPRLILELGPDLRPKTKAEANETLRTKPEKLIGSEMIYEIATSLKEILDNAGGINPKNVPTLDEERAAREQAARVLALQAEEEKRQQTLKQQAEEEKMLQDLVKQREINLTRRENKSTTELNADSIEVNVPGVVAFERSSTVTKSPIGRVVNVNAVHGRTAYRHGPVCTVFTVQPLRQLGGEDTHESLPFLILKECHVSTSNGNESSIKRAIQNLESKLEFHTGLSPHQSVMKPLNYRIQKHFDGEKPSGWTVIILMELAGRQSLQDTLEIVDKLDIKAVRAWSIRLIEGLQHYHRHGCAHASVHLSNILLEKSDTEQGERKTTIPKWADGGYERDLHFLKTSTAPTIVPVPWTAPEVVKQNNCLMPATDIWDFGICFLQMGFGLAATQHQSPFSLLNELKLTKSLKALLSQVFQIDPKKRPSAWDLLHFEFFRNDDALLEGEHSEEVVSGSGSLPKMAESRRFHPRRESYTAPPSRYAQEFVEEGRLGRGGFGEVFRARNKIDGQPYAVKKIKASSRSALDPVLSEVTVLSRLNHPNVVRYFASWIDDGIMDQGPDESDSSDDDLTSSVTNDGRRPVLPASSRGLDFISASSADIVFAYNDDGEASSTDEEAVDGFSNSNEPSEVEGAKPEGHGSIGASDAEPTVWTVLYIQMEYCKQETLRDFINSGLQVNAHECWRLFRQMVQGLAHIHGLSIVHRDLKPENIFIDSDGDVRVGDFGLARPGDYRTSASGTKPAREVFGSFTKDIGTASYVAPEVRSAGNGKYNEKADMYSLGIILLEMSVPFVTGMERAQTLAKVHREDDTLPLALNNPENTTQAKIFMSLIRHKPSERPSSSELLNSGQIPVQGEDESLRVARRLLTDQHSHFRPQFINSLFQKAQAVNSQPGAIVTIPIDPMQAITLLEDIRTMSRSLPNNLELQAMVRSHLTAIFHRHGAVERTDSPALFPYHTCYPSDDVVQFLSPTDKIMQLPYDLILPNALSLAGQSRPERKTFIFDNVYRVDHLEDQPKIFGEANFDIVSEKSLNLALREAEVIKVIDEIVDTFPNLSSVQMCYHVNHSRLLDAIFEFCDIEVSRWAAVKETISKLHTGKWNWTKVRHELRGPSISIPATSLDELEGFDFRDTWENAVPRLRSILRNTHSLEATFAHVQAVIMYLARFNVKRRVYVSPLSSYNEKFYTGNLLFQCLYDQKRRSVLAAGGRYDQLIRRHQPITSRATHVHAVGFQLAWTSLCANLVSYLEKVAKSKTKKRANHLRNSTWKTRRCDVLVDSFDQDLHDSVGVDILNELWNNNISAELAERSIEDDGENAYTKTEERAVDHNWIILVKSEDVVKVKNTSRKDENEVRTSELVAHLRAEARDRDRQEGRAPKASMVRNGSQHDFNIPNKDRAVDIKILMSQNKGKKVNRKTIVEEAQAHKRAYLQACADSPIVAIETKDEIFEGITETRLSDPESWREFIQGAPPGERQYLGQLQNMLKNTQKEVISSNPNVIVYNFRTKACILYHLGKVS